MHEVTLGSVDGLLHQIQSEVAKVDPANFNHADFQKKVNIASYAGIGRDKIATKIVDALPPIEKQETDQTKLASQKVHLGNLYIMAEEATRLKQVGKLTGEELNTRTIKLQELVDKMTQDKVPNAQIRLILQMAGVKNNTEAPTTSTEKIAKFPLTQEDQLVNKKLIDLSFYANQALRDEITAEDLTKAVQKASDEGVPTDKIKAVLKMVGVPTQEDPTRSKFDKEKPISGQNYVNLLTRYNQVMDKLGIQGRKIEENAFGKFPIGKIMNGPHQGGDNPSARLAYKTIEEALNMLDLGE